MSAPVLSRERAAAPAPIRSDPNPGFLRWLLHLGYDGLWLLATVLGSPWLLYKSLTTRGFASMLRERLGEGLQSGPAAGERPRVLLHGVSVGEVKGAVSLVRALERERPDLEVVVSVTTNTGLEVARNLFPHNRVVRFPADIAFISRRFLREIRPACVVLVELEIWPNFLREANRAGLPVAVVNGRITEDSFARYRIFKSWLPQFSRISLFCVQSEEYAARFRSLAVDPERLILTGNLKADGLQVGEERSDAGLARLLAGTAGQGLLVAGSTHPPEERFVAEAWRRGAPEARLVIVPRHPKRIAEVLRNLAALDLAPQRLTELRAGQAADPGRPLIVDTIGELDRIYGMATVVFVGGSLVPHGGQNMLEPAALGRPVLFGPSVANFTQEARLLLSAGAGIQVADPEELARELGELWGDAERRERMGRAGRRAVEEQQGATALTLAALEERCLPPRPPQQPVVGARRPG